MLRAAITTIFAIFLAFPSFALEGVKSVSFLEGWRDRQGLHWAGVLVDLEPGWITYWRSTQGGGIPPAFNVKRRENLSGHTLFHPKPERLEQFEKYVLGYKNQVLFPISFKSENADADIHVSAHFHFAICSDVCVPARFEIDTNLAADANQGVKNIKAALNQGFRSANSIGVHKVACDIRYSDQSFVIETMLNWPAELPLQHVVLEYPSASHWVSPTEVSANGSGTVFSTVIQNYGSSNFLERSKLNLALLTDTALVELEGC
ncbi:MAG: protein-disulfide reductase DsbD domain-containing protein [Pseudomonadota bacterium]